MGAVKVAVAQVPAVLGDVRANCAALAARVAEAAADGVKLIIFPECYLTGYMYPDRATAAAAAISADGAEIREIEALSARHDIEIVVGFLEKRDDSLHNSAAVIGPSGTIGVHRKRHLPFLGVDRFVDEPDTIEPSLFDLRAGRLGVAICYEIRFPEVMRTLALAGADFIALPTNWPVQSVLLATAFTKVRAAENFVYLLVSNRPDAEGDADFLGHSQIVDPLGQVIADAGQREGLVAADVDVARARNKKITFKAGEFEVSPWLDRRPATYRL
jgi:predicted amidohydrolase